MSSVTYPASSGAAANAAPASRAIAVWLLFCCGMVFAMAVIGAITRLTESGLSMVEWKPLIGMLPPLSPGDVLAFPNAGAYGLSASPISFLSHAAPAEVAFAGLATELLKGRPPVEALLAGQSRLRLLGESAVARRAVPAQEMV